MLKMKLKQDVLLNVWAVDGIIPRFPMIFHSPSCRVLEVQSYAVLEVLKKRLVFILPHILHMCVGLVSRDVW